MLDIRSASSQDFSIIREIAEKTWPHAFGKILSPSQIQYMLQGMYSSEALNLQLQQGHIFLLARLHDVNKGFASYELNYKNEERAKLHKLYVHPEAHGTGLGKALIQRVITISKENKQKSLLLNVNRNNLAIEFYKYLGFEVIAEEDIDIGNGFFMNDFVMELPLT